MFCLTEGITDGKNSTLLHFIGISFSLAKQYFHNFSFHLSAVFIS